MTWIRARHSALREGNASACRFLASGLFGLFYPDRLERRESNRSMNVSLFCSHTPMAI